MIRNLVFDFGGVIVDIDREQAVQAFVRMGLADAGQRLDAYHQTGVFQELEDGSISEETFREEMERLASRRLTSREVQEAWMGFFTGICTRKLHLLEELRRKGYRLYLLSNTNPFVMRWARSAEFTAEGKPLDEYFDKLYLSYQIGCMKPDRRIFEYLLSDAQINPAETLFVDDGEANVRMGQAMGMQTLQAKNAADWCDDLLTLLERH